MLAPLQHRRADGDRKNGKQGYSLGQGFSIASCSGVVYCARACGASALFG